MRTGKPIVYTSADSVFQIAAHEDVIPIAEQYRICEIAFDLVARGMGVGRVIARPFVGAPGSFKRTANRHDYALEPTGETLLDRLTRAGVPVVAIGKINDLFAGRGITRAMPHGQRRRRHGSRSRTRCATASDGLDLRQPRRLRHACTAIATTSRATRPTSSGSTSALGAAAAGAARRRPAGRDRGSRQRSRRTPSTDHSREYVPLLLVRRPRVRRRRRTSGRGATFADLGQTLAETSASAPLAHGTSFLEDIVVHHS